MGRPSVAHPYGYLLPIIQKIKEVAKVPVMGVGRISPEAGEKAIAQGQLDMAVMARALLADPELPNKVATGKVDEIRPCGGCNECVFRAIARYQTPKPVAAQAVAAPPPSGIDQAVEQIATQHSLPPQLIRSVIKVESNYNPYAVSAKGAQGLMQLMPSTARRFGVADVFNPVDNIRGGARYLKEVFKH